jgi:hypothetical protein
VDISTLSLGIIILSKSITSVHNIPATFSLRILIYLNQSLVSTIVAGILWTSVIDLGKIIIPRLRVAGILWTLVIDLGKLIIPRLRVAGILWTQS